MCLIQIAALTSPDPAIRAEVRQWVTSTGAQCEDYPNSLRCTATVGAVNELLSTKLSAFKQHTKAGRTIHRLHPKDSYEVPAELEGKLLFLTNLADFPTVKRRNGVFHGINADAKTGKVEATDYS